jgi:hypothetical protein
MKITDVAIVGGGLVGSTAAAMLGRAGIPTVLVDPRKIYPPDFRVEKVSGGVQLDRFWKTGLADAVLSSATRDGENWIARFGWLDTEPSIRNDVRPIRQHDPRSDSTPRRYRVRESRSHLYEPTEANAHTLKRRDNLRKAGGSCKRVEYWAPSRSWYRSCDHQRLPLYLCGL